jgi:hypothetical protein
LWQRDIETSFSCQGYEDSPAYILFPADYDAERFESRLWLYGVPYQKDDLAGGVRVMFDAADLPKLTGVA